MQIRRPAIETSNISPKIIGIDKELPNYQNINEYIKYLKTNFKPEGRPYLNRFFCFNYKFSKDYPYKELKFYDWFPLAYIFDFWKDGFIGINFHHMPVKQRRIWLNRVVKLSQKLDEVLRYVDLTNKKMLKIPGLDYPKVYKILLKSKICIRRYRVDRIKDLRTVPIWKLPEVMKFYARTYFGVGIEQIDRRWLEAVVRS